MDRANTNHRRNVPLDEMEQQRQQPAEPQQQIVAGFTEAPEEEQIAPAYAEQEEQIAPTQVREWGHAYDMRRLGAALDNDDVDNIHDPPPYSEASPVRPDNNGRGGGRGPRNVRAGTMAVMALAVDTTAINSTTTKFGVATKIGGRTVKPAIIKVQVAAMRSTDLPAVRGATMAIRTPDPHKVGAGIITNRALATEEIDLNDDERGHRRAEHRPPPQFRAQQPRAMAARFFVNCPQAPTMFGVAGDYSRQQPPQQPQHGDRNRQRHRR
ncbi:hypothetical protein CSUB01_04373 [Colletotrichum sublineola]|uniref:Uncharacterized protein n=1 Tax=Colletotrichum sublineola TaxID=1173701 RepID=A0A066XY19_COLSU|nr:hypothetical protein CSUB01_04373 [Colletotrichum sublineola]